MPVTQHITVWRSFAAYRKEVAALKTELAASANCPTYLIRFKNFKQFKNGHRYLYFTAGSAFGKLACQAETKVQLQRESASTKIAHSIGLPAVEVFAPYFELNNGYGAFLVRRLSNRFGSLIQEYRDTEQIGPAASDRYATLAAGAILNGNFRTLDSAHPSSQLLRNEKAAWAVHSPKTITKKIREISALYALQTVKDTLPECFPTCDFERLSLLFSSLESNVNELCERYKYSSSEYFAHNDTTVKNMHFGTGKRKGNALLLDFEMASASHYPILSLLRDITQFYSFSSYNQTLQQQFLYRMQEIECDHVPIASGSDRHLILKTAVLFGTLHLGHFLLGRALESVKFGGTGLKKAIIEDSEHRLVFELFKNSLGNLNFLEELASPAANELPSLLTESLYV